ncbi:hypothetical protein CSPX01_10077 [Colletotrichum filicis]|nr:hypothetical protein CSPX01_10077 [Colletotrichum filicis]
MGAKTSLQQLRRQRASSGPDKVPVLVQTLDEYTRSITALYSYTSAAVVTEKAHATRRDASTRRNARGLRAGTHMEVAQGMDLNNTIRLASPPTPYHRLSAAARPSGPLDAGPARHKHLELRGQGTAAATRSSPAVCRALKAW